MAPTTFFAITDFATQVLRDLGLVGLAGLMFAENIFPPIPSEVMLPLGGYFVAQGDLSFIGVLTASTLGSLMGSIVLYELARAGGRPLILRYGRVLRLTDGDLDRAEQWFVRRGRVVVLLGRCVPGVRSIVSLPAGMLRMPRATYIALTLVGTLIWNTALIGAGWVLGEEWESVSGVVSGLSRPLLLVLVAAFGLASMVWWSRRRREQPHAPEGQ